MHKLVESAMNSRPRILKDDMSTFLPVDEQMDLLEKGAAEIIRAADLRERLEESRKTGRPLRVKAGFEEITVAKTVVDTERGLEKCVEEGLRAAAV